MRGRYGFASIAIGVALAALPPSAGSSVGTALIDTGLLSATSPTPVIARFDAAPATNLDGFEVLYRFQSIPAVYGIATPGAMRALASRDDLDVLERADKPIALMLDTATTASGARSVWEGNDVITDANGRVIDGSGIGIAVVDSGLDALHPDFAAPGKIGGNYHVQPGGVVAADHTARTSGHGTHVAGIAAGTGAASGGIYRGAAPGATLYAFSVTAPPATIAFPSIAFDWILTNGAAQQPPISVVNNSWQCAGAACQTLNRESTHITLASMMAQQGIVVTWAAGNDGGDGFQAQTTIESRDPTPGVISVANYSDGDTGRTDSCVRSSSSRGRALDPSTWPDVAAPGNNIISTWALAAESGTATLDARLPEAGPYPGKGNYKSLGGTSMAAPHVAGIVALMRQANPVLDPREIEYILKATARKLTTCTIGYARANPAHPYDGANYRDGHGLVDARAAAQAAIDFTGIPATPEPDPLPASFLQTRIGVEAQRTFYLRPDESLSEQPPAGVVPPRAAFANESHHYTSAPFTAEASFSGIEVELWLGHHTESVAIQDATYKTYATVELLRGATTQPIASDFIRPRFTHTLGPMYRLFVFPLAAPVTFQPGDRLRLTIVVRDAASTRLPEDLSLTYMDARAPSRVSLGAAIWPAPTGSAIECQLLVECARVGGERHLTTFACSTGPLRVNWSGPPGSSATAQCTSGIATCTVPGEAGDPWGNCVAQSLLVASGSESGVCFYRDPDGAVVGEGRCASLTPRSEAD